MKVNGAGLMRRILKLSRNEAGLSSFSLRVGVGLVEVEVAVEAAEARKPMVSLPRKR